MINKGNFQPMLSKLGFSKKSGNNVWSKSFPSHKCKLEVDFEHERLIYPKELTVYDETTSNFEHPENFVVFECVHRLLEKGYRPEHIELEKRWTLGHEQKSGKADICVYKTKTDEEQKMLFIIECKTAGRKYQGAKKTLIEDGGQLFSYWQQERGTEWVSLYASDFVDGNVTYVNDIISCLDDKNVELMAKKDSSVHLYKNAHTAVELFEVWSETYAKQFHSKLIFGDDTVAYKIGVKPLRKKDLQDFKPEDKIVNRFEEILRHNNVSDKENAFNRLVALFICKLVDEIGKTDEQEVEFQYKVGTDTYESLQDRLQRLHRDGMERFMKEKIEYVADDYAERLFAQKLNGEHRQNAINDLKRTIRILKFYSNNDFTFKDVHNEELFYQNGKILVEVVQLFEGYRIVYPSKHQFLGDLFEQLLGKGFKQNEGQFFTPTPITRYIWDCLPLEKIVPLGSNDFPKIIDYACGAGHFLTEAVEAINAYFTRTGRQDLLTNNSWVEKSLFGIEKDYRLARVAKVSLYMNGAGEGRIVFGDGLEQYVEKGIENGTFDILVANPPYSVSGFKSHLKLKNNSFELLKTISNEGSEIEVLFIERISQLLKPNGIAAVILPFSILTNDSGSYTGARETILKNFYIRAITSFGGKTFGATSTNTIVLFLEKFNEPPKRCEIVQDSVDMIFSGNITEEWEDTDIFEAYVETIGVSEEDYWDFVDEKKEIADWEDNEYFNLYVEWFNNSTDIVHRKADKAFKRLSEAEQAKDLRQRFYDKVKTIEREKLFYFGLIYQQSTLIITAPSDTAAQKDFLGYEWSNRRGSEGIVTRKKGGQLYNDSNRSDENTLAACVRGSYNEIQKSIEIDESLYTYSQLKEMLDFSRTSFNKAIKLMPDKKIEIVSKYPLGKLGAMADVKRGSTITAAERVDGNIKVVAGGTDYAYLHNVANREANIITVSASGANAGYVNYWREPIFASDCTTIQGSTEQETLFLYNYLKCIQDKIFWLQKGSAQPHVYASDLAQIPVPMVDDESVKKKLVEACEKIEKEFETSRMTIEAHREKIANLFSTMDIAKLGGATLRLSNHDLFEISIGRRILNRELVANGEIPVYSANVQEPFGMIDRLLISDFSKNSVLWGIDGDWMVNYIKKDTPFFPTDHCGVLRVDEDTLNPHFIMYMLEIAGRRAGFSRSYRASIDRIEGLTIPAVPLKEQNALMKKVEEIEGKIHEELAKMANLESKRRSIVESFIAPKVV